MVLCYNNSSRTISTEQKSEMTLLKFQRNHVVCMFGGRCENGNTMTSWQTLTLQPARNFKDTHQG